mmetsp:Transcript_19267/g.55971  ORF Transcript_19267/g.55971 Transcript_19267/m.55971 type:complete len:231 (+) Transcript_19267:1572-2264(+)
MPANIFKLRSNSCCCLLARTSNTRLSTRLPAPLDAEGKVGALELALSCEAKFGAPASPPQSLANLSLVAQNSSKDFTEVPWSSCKHRACNTLTSTIGTSSWPFMLLKSILHIGTFPNFGGEDCATSRATSNLNAMVRRGSRAACWSCNLRRFSSSRASLSSSALRLFSSAGSPPPTPSAPLRRFWANVSKSCEIELSCSSSAADGCSDGCSSPSPLAVLRLRRVGRPPTA